MCSLQLKEAKFKLHQHQYLYIPQFCLSAGQFWAVVGSNGSGKTAFALALQQQLALEHGEYCHSFRQVALLSFEKQQHIIEATFKDRNHDGISPDDFGKSAQETILNGTSATAACEKYAEILQITSLLDRPFIHLSTGESRKVLLCQALVSQPDLLILDEPFEGLDQQSVQDWRHLLERLKEKMTLMLIINRFSDIPTQATHIAILDNRELVLQGERQYIEQQSLFQQLYYAENARNEPLPTPFGTPIHLPTEINPFELKNVNIQYGDKKILSALTWTVEPKQHWWIKGPNGAGKSTLLSVLTGDHPQSYANHVVLFGQQRGSGETIWDIKQKIGYVSSQLHMDYRVNCSALDVILSGFFDSIGVYQQVSEALRLKAMQWLTRLHLATLAKVPFRSLSWGQQRLLLIARAMVKHPPILILDEPFQGLDGVNRKLVKQFIEQLVVNSQTQLIFVSHQDQDAPNCMTHRFEFIADNNQYSYIQSTL
ncbi:TPA: molybdate ABC transporter ATP-binding protein ModF [Pasteurella multocida]|nr:molybdate ABC transporter ATP-binding protein ModF [Pasteurella multocida]HDR1016017.1 molybdate ABC transporter ATP-binding protein ModF [Pasteurella multocida]HDR1017887.1 molybdate ABC transporter ATP-binding protein ModF [Pasteurella multocida]HDR1210433.1 molybdate ABC transporter ATP-binding protein ModF [Pasteurella multocida]HDR1246574.1 molybdate ABC transporter ATP-binding protein ModF [Pasteurella multocida]